MDDGDSGRLGTRRVVAGWVLALVGVPALTAALLAADNGTSRTALEAMLYLSLAVAVALVGGRWPALAAAVLGALLLNYYFIPPLRTLNVASGNDLLTLAVFTVTAVAVAAVVDSATRRRHQARAAESEAGLLAMLNRTVLGGEYDVPRLLALARDTFGAESADLVTDEPPAAAGTAVVPAGAPLTDRLMVSAEPLTRAVLMVLPPLPPCCRETAVGLALIEKSFGGGVPPQLGNLKVPTRVFQLKAPLAGMYWFAYQKVQSSLGSTVIEL